MNLNNVGFKPQFAAYSTGSHTAQHNALPQPRVIADTVQFGMKRKDFLRNTILGSIILGTNRLPALTPTLTPPPQPSNAEKTISLIQGIMYSVIGRLYGINTDSAKQYVESVYTKNIDKLTTQASLNIGLNELEIVTTYKEFLPGEKDSNPSLIITCRYPINITANPTTTTDTQLPIKVYQMKFTYTSANGTNKELLIDSDKIDPQNIKYPIYLRDPYEGHTQPTDHKSAAIKYSPRYTDDFETSVGSAVDLWLNGINLNADTIKPKR